MITELFVELNNSKCGLLTQVQEILILNENIPLPAVQAHSLFI